MLKLKTAIPCARLTKLIEAMLTNRHFKVHIGEKSSRFKTVRNGLPQGSVLAPLLFNLYISDVPETSSQKFAYADDMALATQSKKFSDGEQILNSDLETLNQYYSKWRLCPNPEKTEVTAFHLNNRLAHQQLNINFCQKRVKHNYQPKYLGVTLDRSLTYKSHLIKVGAKLKTRNNMIKNLAGTTWGADGETLRTAAQALVYTAAEYCAPVWQRSAHTEKVDVQLNETMRIITGTLKTTPKVWLPVLSHIEPPKLRRLQATENEWQKYHSPENQYPLPIQQTIDNPPPSRLRSRKPIWTEAVTQHPQPLNKQEIWRREWLSADYGAITEHIDPTKQLPGSNLPRKLWCKLNRLRTGHGRCKANLYKWGIITSPECECGEPEQTIHHITWDCPIRRFHGELKDLVEATPTAIEWITHLDVDL